MKVIRKATNQELGLYDRMLNAINDCTDMNGGWACKAWSELESKTGRGSLEIKSGFLTAMEG